MATKQANAINETGASGLVNFDGTATFSTTSSTQYNVYTGGAGSNTINNVAPSATSGIPFISQGSSSQPTFGTAVVAGGGTGNTTFTAYSVITAGTTATGAFQNVSGVGTSGQILTSNGASALPTWQANSGGFTPNSTINLFDDFTGVSASSAVIISTYSWGGSGSGSNTMNGNPAVSSTAHPGLVGNGSLTSGTTAASLYLCSLGNNSFLLGGGAITLNFVFNIATLSNSTNRYTLVLGLGDFASKSASAQANGCYFLYSDNVNSGEWEFITSSASTATTDTSSTSVTSAWHNAQITVNAAASSVNFTMDGVSLGNIITNIPTTNPVSPFIAIIWSAGTIAANSVITDLFYMNQALTTAR
jgi:hypothetical protein